MADNILLNGVSVAGGQTIATDEIGGIEHELVKLEFGVDGVATMVSASDPLPVTFNSSSLATAANQETQITAEQAILAKIIAAPSTEAKQDTGNTSLASIKTNTDNLATPTTVINGKKTVTTAGTRVALAASTAVKSVTIKALAANTGLIYVGDSSVASTNGFQLSAYESVSLDIANLSTINIDSAINGDGVSFLAVV